MSDSFLDAAMERAIDAAAILRHRPLPNDDALAALELHGSVCELGAGDGVWSALLRKRGLIKCVSYDCMPPDHAYTHVLRGGHEMASQHADRTLLLVRGAEGIDFVAALQAFVKAGGSVLAYAGRLALPAAQSEFAADGAGSATAPFETLLTSQFELHVTVTLPGLNGDLLTFWRRKPPISTGASACGVLDVRLELVDMEAPDWAAAPKPPAARGPEMTVENGGRTIRPTMDRAAFEAALPDDF